MSKYTTEVRFICEQASGLTESVGLDDVNTVLANSYDSIFDNSWDIFDENYRETLCTKILKHYYTNEICAETVGLWKLWLNERMGIIMPYYNQLYNSTLYDFEPFQDINYTEEYSGTGTSDSTDKKITNTDTMENNSYSDNYSDNISNNEDSTNQSDTETDRTLETTTDSEGDSNTWNYYSDTPQGGLDGITSNTYLTNVTHNADEVEFSETTNDDENLKTTKTDTFNKTQSTTRTNSKSSETTSTGNKQDEINSTNDTDTTTEYLKKVYGKYNSSKSYAELLIELRKTFLNIDAMLIAELQDLFITLW